MRYAEAALAEELSDGDFPEGNLRSVRPLKSCHNDLRPNGITQSPRWSTRSSSLPKRTRSTVFGNVGSSHSRTKTKTRDRPGMPSGAPNRDGDQPGQRYTAPMTDPPRDGVFPFGRTVLPRPPSAASQRRLFILGAYPSAFHVSWRPHNRKPIRAMAVDNEPEPFWTGADEAVRLAHWKAEVKFSHTWGEVHGVGALNGSSGLWVEENVLKPLGATRADAWITDCLDTYRCSDGLAARIADTYAPFAAEEGLPAAQLAGHPSENAIVEEALRVHRQRLLQELATAKPELIVTLGNAALRVLRELPIALGGPAALHADAGYGKELRVTVAGVTARWLPLAHPAAPKRYQVAHAAWVAAR